MPCARQLERKTYVSALQLLVLVGSVPRAQLQALLILGILEEHGLANVGMACVEVARNAEQKEGPGRVGSRRARRQLSSEQPDRSLSTEALAEASRPTTKRAEVRILIEWDNVWR